MRRGISDAARAAVVIAGALVVAASPTIRADEGWVIDRLAIQFDIQRDSSVQALEAVDVDFRGLSRHGIFRDLVYLTGYDATHDREYGIDLQQVTSADGHAYPVKTSTVGALRRFQIGDPNRTLSGKASYRIAYRIGGALNAFADHDELYWNATGTWPVRVEAASVVVRAPAEAIERVACFQGAAGSAEPCEARQTADEATFTATRPLDAGAQLTIVVGLRKGAVAEPQPHLVAKPRDLTQFFDHTPQILGLAAVGLLAAVGGVSWLWWRKGRDRRFVSQHYLGQGDREEPAPLLDREPVAVEFEPPDAMRPGQMGLLLDERADTLDATATIIDLAVRGYVKITEVPKAGWFGHADWQLDQLKPADPSLLDYERIILEGLFKAGSPRTLSELKNKFYTDLALAKHALYTDAVARGWFPRNPNTVRIAYRLLGGLVLFVGAGLMFLLGAALGGGLLGTPVMAGGLLLMIAAGSMPRRTAKGRDAMMRTLGFVKYIRTAEVPQQAFAERAKIFTAYLPYAIAFKCVDRWARAFKDIDLQAATAGWYAGSGPFNLGTFQSNIGHFSTSVSNTIASTPGGSGGSGFSGGSSGGGGGGGGGGSW